MGTERFYTCDKCGPTRVSERLFQVLCDHARKGGPPCPRCNGPAALQLGFSFGLNAGDRESTVRDCFLPQELEKWKDTSGDTVTFYPFLVIVDRHQRELAVWLPYWHTVEDGHGTKLKYGQWAPFMDEHLFLDLVSQARKKGYFAHGGLAV
jgi:hypothetical protein